MAWAAPSPGRQPPCQVSVQSNPAQRGREPPASHCLGFLLLLTCLMLHIMHQCKAQALPSSISDMSGHARFGLQVGAAISHESEEKRWFTGRDKTGYRQRSQPTRSPSMAWATRPRGDQIPQIRYPRVISYRVNHSSNNTCMRQTDHTNFWLGALKFKTLPSNKGLFLRKDEHWDGHNKGDGFISHAADFLTSTWRKKGSWAGGR